MLSNFYKSSYNLIIRMYLLFLVVLLFPYVSKNAEAFLSENIVKSNIIFTSSDHRFIQECNGLYLFRQIGSSLNLPFSQSDNDLVGSMASLIFSSFQSKIETLQTPIDTSFSFSSISQLSPVNNAIVSTNNNIDNKMYFTSEFMMSPYNNSTANRSNALISIPNTQNKNILGRIKRKIIRVVGHIPLRVRNGLLNNNPNKSPIKKKKSLFDRLKGQIARTWLGDDAHNTRRWENAINNDVIGSGIFVSSKPIRKNTEIISYQNDTQKHRLRNTFIFITNPLREVIRKFKDHKNHKNDMQLHLFGNNKDIPIFDSNDQRKLSATVSGWQSQSTSMEKYSPLTTLSNKLVPDRSLQRIGKSDLTSKKFGNIPTSNNINSNNPHPHPMEFAKSVAKSIFSIAAESGYSLQLAIANHNAGATVRSTTDSTSSPKASPQFELKFPDHHIITAAKDTIVNATAPIQGYYNSASDFISSLTSWTKNDFVWDLNYRPEIPFFEPFTKLLSFNNNNNLPSGITTTTDDSSDDKKNDDIITTNLIEDEPPNLFAEDIQLNNIAQSMTSKSDTVEDSKNDIIGKSNLQIQGQSPLTTMNEPKSTVSYRRGTYNFLSILFPLISPFTRYDNDYNSDTDIPYETSIDYRGGTTTTTTTTTIPRSPTSTILSFPFSLLRRIISFIPVIRLIPLLLFPESVTVEIMTESMDIKRRRGGGSSDLIVDIVDEITVDSPPVPVSVTSSDPALTIAGGDTKTLEYSPYLPPKVARQIIDGVIARAGQNSTYFERSVDTAEEVNIQQKLKVQQQNQLLPFSYGLEPQMSIDDSIAVKLGRSPELRNRPAFISKERIPIPTKGDFALLKAKRLQSVISAALNVVSEEDVSNFLTFISMTPLIEALTIPISSDYSPDMRINATKGICRLIRSNRNIAAVLAANPLAVSVLSELIEAPLKGFKTFRSAPDKERDLRGQREAVALVQRVVRSSSKAVELLQQDDRLRKALVSVATQPDMEVSFLAHDINIPLLLPTTPNSKSDPTKSAANKAMKKKGLPVIVDFNKLKVSEMARVAAWGLGGLPWKPKLPAQRGLRILCFDGGGTRGVLSVAVLKELMNRVGGKTSPFGMFDIICGTSTGGIIATLLGVKLRGIDEVETLYDNLVVKIFSKKSNLRLATDQALYDEVEWEKILYTICGDELLVDSNQKEEVPRVFCVSASLSMNPPKPVLWRNYNYPPGQSSRYPGTFQANTDMAVRATTSAPTFFKPVFFNNSFFCDGAIVANNPAAISLQEAKALYPGIPVELVISIGTGMHNGVSKSNVMGWDVLVNNFIAATVDTEDPHYLLENFLSPEQYYRFNPVLKENYPIDITDSKILNSLKQSAKEYFSEMEMNDGKRLEQLLKLMRGR